MVFGKISIDENSYNDSGAMGTFNRKIESYSGRDLRDISINPPIPNNKVITKGPLEKDRIKNQKLPIKNHIFLHV